MIKKEKNENTPYIYKFSTCFKFNENVWINCLYDDGFYRTEKHKIMGFEYYPKDNIVLYILDNESRNIYYAFEIFNNYKEAKKDCEFLNKLKE